MDVYLWERTVSGGYNLCGGRVSGGCLFVGMGGCGEGQ